MTTKDLEQQARLKQLLHYDPASGNFTWSNPTNRRIVKGTVAGTFGNDGYMHIHFDGKRYSAHRLVWLYVYGEWPDTVDHVNGIRTDNRVSNLRNTNNTGNMQNLKAKRGTSKYIGVYWHKSLNKWKAQIGVNGRRVALGYFDNEEDAHQAYWEAKQKHHEYWAKEVAA